MKHKYEVEASVLVSRWYDVVAESEKEAHDIVSRMVESDVISVWNGKSGDWVRIDDKIEQVLKSASPIKE